MQEIGYKSPVLLLYANMELVLNYTEGLRHELSKYSEQEITITFEQLKQVQ
jgi:hypothetical protein